MSEAVAQQENTPHATLSMAWTVEMSDALQSAVDEIFGNADSELSKFSFSLTIADPLLDGCPLIGCSTGFTTLCGYEMHEIIGRNCRFLVDPVPPELVDANVRAQARKFCNSVRDGTEYRLSETEHKAWMPMGTTSGELFCAQMNARRNGTLFRNMFYLRAVELDDRHCILGLQTELLGSPEDEELARRACRRLSANMQQVERVLAAQFWYSSSLRRQDVVDPNDGYQEETTVKESDVAA